MKKTAKILVILTGLLLVVGFIKVQAQQDPMYTQYMYNTLSVNPAYAGSRGVMNITGLVRSQWTGIDGAPRTQTLFIHSPLANMNAGVGLSIINDKVGPINQTMIFGDYSYTIKVNEKSKLAFGLKAGVNIIQGELAGLNTTEPNDAAFNQDLESGINPAFGFGMYYHSDKWYVGASTPNMLRISLKNDGDNTQNNRQSHYFLIGGYVWEINNDIAFKPTVLTKVTAGAPISIDLTASVILKNKLWLGISYRWADSFGALIGCQLTDQLRVGYAYDYTTSDLTSYTTGSHEILINYDFFFSKSKLRSPRYF